MEKNITVLNLKISSNVVGDSNVENNFLHKLLLVASVNNSSANIKVSKTQLHKDSQENF